MIITCSYCGNEFKKSTGHVNRARKMGLKLFCNRTCFTLNRRIERTLEEKKLIKREYDRGYREKNKETLKEKKDKYYKSPAGRATQKRNREKFKEQHKQYIRSEKYRLGYKKQYDEKYQAQKKYGEFYEAAIVLKKIEQEIAPELYEAKLHNGLLNKSQKRKRKWNSMQKI